MCKNFDLALLLLLENNKINDVKIAEATGVSRAALSKLRKQATERKTRFFNESRILSLKKNLDLSVCLSREINLLVRGSDALIKKFLVDGDGNESLAILNLEESDFGDCIVELLDKIYEVPEREVIISTCNIKKFKELLGTTFEDLNTMKLNNLLRAKMLSIMINYYSIHLQMFNSPKSIHVFNEVFK